MIFDSVKMFLIITMERQQKLEPKYFGKRLKEHVHKALVEEVEGKCDPSFGFVVAVTKVHPESIKLGKLEEYTGLAVFKIRYDCLVIKPEKGDIIDALVKEVIDDGILCSMGPLDIMVSQHNFDDDDHFALSADKSAWVSEDKEVVIKERCVIRLKVVAVLYQNIRHIFTLGSIKGPFLGLLQNAE